jgi:hypothetical protein
MAANADPPFASPFGAAGAAGRTFLFMAFFCSIVPEN